MTSGSYTEDTLVQRTTAEYLEQNLGWRSVYAYNKEDFGPKPTSAPAPFGVCAEDLWKPLAIRLRR